MTDQQPIKRGLLPKATPAQSLAIFLAASAAAAALLIPGFEGHRNYAYPDPATGGKPWTICDGSTLGVKKGDHATNAECVVMTARDAQAHGVAISKCVHRLVPLKSATAFTSFAYNVGVANFCASTVARRLNEGDLPGACAAMSAWVYAAGKKMPGLVKRRARERAYCELGLE